jgi:hypothetical protein
MSLSRLSSDPDLTVHPSPWSGLTTLSRLGSAPYHSLHLVCFIKSLARVRLLDDLLPNPFARSMGPYRLYFMTTPLIGAPNVHVPRPLSTLIVVI